jgi:hypothetical protein
MEYFMPTGSSVTTTSAPVIVSRPVGSRAGREGIDAATPEGKGLGDLFGPRYEVAQHVDKSFSVSSKGANSKVIYTVTKDGAIVRNGLSYFRNEHPNLMSVVESVTVAFATGSPNDLLDILVDKVPDWGDDKNLQTPFIDAAKQINNKISSFEDALAALTPKK